MPCRTAAEAEIQVSTARNIFLRNFVTPWNKQPTERFLAKENAMF